MAYRPSIQIVFGPAHFYEVHKCGHLLSETEWCVHSELPRTLVRIGPFGGRVEYLQVPAPQSFKMPGSQDQPSQVLTVSQPANIFPGSSSRFSPNAGLAHVGAHAIQQHAPSFRVRVSLPLRIFQKILHLMVTASSVVLLCLLYMRPLQYWLKPGLGHLYINVECGCVLALAPWKDPHLY